MGETGSDPHPDPDERLSALEDRVDGILRRLEALERRPEPDAASPLPGEAGEGSPTSDWSVSRTIETLLDRHRVAHLAGLASLVLAGAIILRNVTISSPVPLWAGASLGLAYCAFLLVVADRKFRSGPALHGDVFTVLSILILDALLVEVTRKTGGFSRETGYAVLLAFLAAFSCLTILRRRPFPFLVAQLAGIAAALAIGGRPFLHPWFAGVQIAAVLAGHLAMARSGWRGVRWAPGLLSLLYIGMLGFFARTAATRDIPHLLYAEPAWALAIFIAFYTVHVLFSVGVALFRPRRLDEYEAAMAILGALVVPGAALGMILALPNGLFLFGATMGGLTLLFYVVACLSYARHGAESGSFYPLTAIALLYAIVSPILLLGWTPPLGTVYVGLALGLAVFASRYGKASISFQAHFLTFLSFLVLSTTAIRLVPPEVGEAGTSLWLPLAGVATVAVFARLRTFRRPGERFRLEELSLRSVSLVLLLAAGGIEILASLVPVVHSLGGLVVRAADPEVSAAVWFTAQTILLVVGATAMLAFGTRLKLGGVTALATALLILGGLKLFLYDALRVPGGFVVVSSAVFGIAMILASLIYRRGRTAVRS